jgi:Mrp family chromosome partitioning ATPase
MMGVSSMKSPDPFSVIRATVEAEIAAPGVLTISSACAGDGKTAVATGVARSLAAAGYRTLLIDAAGVTAESLSERLGVPPPAAVSVTDATPNVSGAVRPAFPGCDVLALAAEGEAGPSAVALAEMFAAVRSQYDYAIVDARAVDDGGATFARCADGVVLAVREGRAAVSADGDAVALLERIRARFMGVVATEPAPRTRTRTRRTEHPAGTPAPRRTTSNVVARLFDLFSSNREDHGPAVGSTTSD